MLDNPAARGNWEVQESTILRWGQTECHFYSGAPTANIVGATADILLELDECQDLTAEKIDRDLLPMVASTNATRVYYGTAWDTDNPLETQKRHNLELEARDGIKRHFEYDWTVLAAISDNYRRFVEGEIARLGIDHPTIQTQYLLHAIDDAGKLFPRAMREALQGSTRASTPAPTAVGTSPASTSPARTPPSPSAWSPSRARWPRRHGGDHRPRHLQRRP